ncbi:MAG: hypothetical protein WC205_07485 [Opitutaceae bacterium]|jgi:outer membrane biosynthesis protein TonB
MATAFNAFAELSAHTLNVAVVSGRKVVALRSFPLDAKSDITHFVTEHQLTGTVRSSVLGGENFLHRSTDAEAGAVRQPASLLTHVAKLPHGFSGTVGTVVVDAVGGNVPDATRISPWLMTVIEAESLSSAKTTLAGFGLSTPSLTLAASIQLGAVMASLAAGEIGVVLLPGENDGHLVWVSPNGVQSVSPVPVGFSQIFEAVQIGLGLKFKAAACKLFYNENYDFEQSSSKIAAHIAAALRPILIGPPSTRLHIAGLLPTQSWLVDHVSKALGLAAWAPSSSATSARLGLDTADVSVTAATAGVIQLAVAGSNDAPWVQSFLDVVAAKSRTVAPMLPPKSAAVTPPSPIIAVTPIPVAPVTPPPQPAPKQTAMPVIKSVDPVTAPPPEPAPVTEPTPPAPAATPTPARKNMQGPIIIGSTIVVVAAAVGIAAYFKHQAAPSAPTAVTAPVAPSTAPKPAPVVATPVNAVPDDQLASDPHKFRNTHYHFEVTEKGYIQALSTIGDEVIITSAGSITLQSSYVGSDGRRKWVDVGGIADDGYQAIVSKSVKDGVTRFDIRVTHPRFVLSQTFTCLAQSIRVSADFTAIDLRDPRGRITAVNSVNLAPDALNPSAHMQAAADRFAYTMKSGKLVVSFDNTAWARDGADGRQPITAGENNVAFQFTESADAAHNSLAYEITLP